MFFLRTTWAVPAMLILCGMAACVSILVTPEDPLTPDGKERPTYKTDPNFAIRSNCQTFPSGVNDRQLFDCATAAWDRAHYTALVVGSKMSSTRDMRRDCFGFDLPRDVSLKVASQAVFVATGKCLSAVEQSIKDDSADEQSGDMMNMLRSARNDIEDGIHRLPEAMRP